MLLSIFLAFLVSLGLTGILRQYALNHGIIDSPNERSSHTTPTPRGGGVSFVITFLAGFAFTFFFNIPFVKPQSEPFCALFGCGLLIAGIGFWDDHTPLPAKWRFFVHSIAALIGLLLLGIPQIIPGISTDFGMIAYPLGVLSLVWLLNLFNFMDGIDGFAGVEAMFVGVSAVAIMHFGVQSDSTVFVFWLSILMAGVAGFLVWNWPPAKIFMGDSGSGFLGIMLPLFAIWGVDFGLTIWVWIILLASFISDATVTLIRRILLGQRWSQAHRSHLYQQLSRDWQSHRSVTLALTLVNLLWLLPWAFLAACKPTFGLLAAGIAYLPLVMLAIKLDAGIEETKPLRRYPPAMAQD